MSVPPLEFGRNFFQGIIHNGLTENGDHSKVGFIPVDQLKQEDFLSQSLAQDFQAAGLSPFILRGIRTVEFQGELLPTHLAIEQEVNLNSQETATLRAIMSIEPDYTDGKQRSWDARFFVFPVNLIAKGELIKPLAIMTEVGYHVLFKKAQDQKVAPLVRIDSLCVTSMLDGHYGTAGDVHLGCDCEPQRHYAQDLIWDNQGGGVSLLSPLSGRANGTAVHAGQIGIQNFAARHGLNLPDTYQSHQLQGVPADARKQYYWIDAAILAMFSSLPGFTLLANNPEKADALRNAGFEVEQQPLHAASRVEYYKGTNYRAKAAVGHI